MDPQLGPLTNEYVNDVQLVNVALAGSGRTMEVGVALLIPHAHIQHPSLGDEKVAEQVGGDFNLLSLDCMKDWILAVDVRFGRGIGINCMPYMMVYICYLS